MSKLPAVTLLSAALAIPGLALAEGAPGAGGVVGNPTLVANQSIAKAQAAGSIMTFMSKGAQECDDQGKHCHSAFGADGNLDYAGMQSKAQSTTGTQAFNFLDKDGGSSNVTAQVATLALACGDTKTHQTAGVAFKASNCLVSANGDAQLTFKVCTAPSRGLPVTPPANAMTCSTDPSQPNFKPSGGKVCAKAACDTEPAGSLNGWSEDITVSWQASLPDTATETEKTNNGLGLVFYPPLNGGVPADFKADSDNMTAVKVVQSFVNSKTHKTAVGLRVAYRHKATVTKDMLQNPASVTNPGDHTAMWDTLLKLQGNALIPKYGQKYAKNGSECLQQLQNGIASDGKIHVCDETYTNESGIKPLARTAQVAAQGQDCGTTEQCLQEVVNTNTWSQTCKADVPLALKTCETTTAYTSETITSTRTMATETCREKRTETVNSCVTQAVLNGVAPSSCPAGTVLVDNWGPNACTYCSDNWQHYKVTCGANNTVNIHWYSATGYTEVSRIVDRTVTMVPFQNAYQELGPFCFDGSGTVPFQTTCTATGCTYTAWITGNCNGATMGLSATGYAAINYDGIITTLNQCSVYEAAH